MPEVLDQIRPAAPASAYIRAKLASLRRKQVATMALTGFAMAIAVAIECLALAMFLDWWLDVPWGMRLLFLVAQAALFTFILLRFALRPILHQPDDDELALRVEKARGAFRSRLIASVQLSRPGAVSPGAASALVDALVQETERMAAPMDFNSIIPTDKLVKLGFLALFVSTLGAFALSAGGASSRDLLFRAFLSNRPVPRKTRITVMDGNRIVGRGDNVRLEAWAAGVIPSNGKIEIKYRGRRSQEFPLEQDRAQRAHFGRTIENVQDSFTYIFYLNDGQSPACQIEAVARPTVSAIQCDQQFPAYTGLKPVRRLLGDLSLLAGSRISLKATASKPVSAAALKFMGAPVRWRMPVLTAFPPLVTMQNAQLDFVPLEIGGNSSNELAGAFTVPAKGLAGFSVLLLDTEGMESRDPAVYRIDCLPDKPPVVRITYPDRKEELITRQAVLPVAFEASDDFQIARLRLHYKLEGVEGGAEQMVELDLEGDHPQRLKRRHEWNIGAFNPLLSEGSRIEYWVEAQDNNDATGPGIGSSEHQFAKVVSENDKRADLLNRAGDYLGSINDLASDQEKLNQKLGAIIREKIGQ